MDQAPITIRDVPSMPPEEVAFLRERLRVTRCLLEYGAGGSTVMAAASGVEIIYSVESDPAFHQAVADVLIERGQADRLRRATIDIGPTGAWGHPLGATRMAAWPDYSAHVWDEIAAAGDAPETILVDGRFRVACCLLSLLRMARGAWLLFDDYFDREDKYGVVTRFAPVAARHGRMAVFHKPAACDVRALREMYATYSTVPL